jgi:S1-C subfamily serine protease
VGSFSDLLVYVALQTRPGQKVTLTIARDGKTMDITVTLGVRPEVVNTNPGQPLPTPVVPPS